jgi:hypothetical protein
MATRNVVLTEPQSKLIDDLVASGRYQNASEDTWRARGPRRCFRAWIG